MSGSNRLSRRDFIKATTGVVGGIIGVVLGIPAIGYFIAPALRKDKAGAPVAIGKLEDIPVGQFHQFSFTITRVNGWERTATNYGGYLLRRSESPDDILVLSSRCTHLSCTVNWHQDEQVFICPCHDAKFGPNGQVLAGPPPAPLAHFDYSVDADGVISIIPVEIKSEA
jgi:quinol---cytochrome c reductase iron-sulfur subunit, bacillus type